MWRHRAGSSTANQAMWNNSLSAMRAVLRGYCDKSTAQIFALNIGIPCYSYHRLLGLEEIVTQYHDATFASAPKEFFMDSLTQTPQPYEPVAHGLQKSQNSLEKLYAIISSH